MRIPLLALFSIISVLGQVPKPGGGSSAAGASTCAGIMDAGTICTHNISELPLLSNNGSDYNAATFRTNLGLGSAALLSSSAVLQTANNLSDLANVATARSNIGAEAVANKSTATGLGTSDTLYPSQNAVKVYVDNVSAGINPATSVKACSAAALPAVTYANGASGIGATLTQNSAAVLVVDGYTVVLGDRLLIKNQASTFQNGVYTVGTLGTGIIPFVLIRALDFDQPSDINNTGPIGCQTGTLGAPGGFPTAWLLTTTVTTVGSDAITFSQQGFGGNTVTASSPGVGIAHFAGSTQTVTSSLVIAADAPTLAVQATIQSNGYLYAADTSSSTTTYTASLTPALTAYTTGMVVLFLPANSNTGASTLNINGLGAKSIIAANTTGSALVADDLIAGTGNVYTLEYDGTAFRKINGPDGAWTGYAYANGYTDNGAPFQVGQYRKLRNGDVQMRGVAVAGTVTSTTIILNMPAGYRPASATNVFESITGNTTLTRYDLTTGGAFSIQNAITGGTYLPLNFTYSVY